MNSTNIYTDDEKLKLEKLYLKYHQLMFNIANDILRDEYLAEDAVHKSFENIIKNLNQIYDVDCPNTKKFLVIVVKHVAIDFYRKRVRENTIPLDSKKEDIQDILNLEKVVIETIEHPIMSAILSLPNNYSEIILLRYDNEYTETEIAYTLGLSKVNVKKRLQRAKSKLKQNLKQIERFNYI